MTLKEIDQHFVQWKVRNTWAMAGEISSRINDEPGPGNHDFLVSVTRYPHIANYSGHDISRPLHDT